MTKAPQQEPSAPELTGHEDPSGESSEVQHSPTLGEVYRLISNNLNGKSEEDYLSTLLTFGTMPSPDFSELTDGFSVEDKIKCVKALKAYLERIDHHLKNHFSSPSSLHDTSVLILSLSEVEKWVNGIIASIDDKTLDEFEALGYSDIERRKSISKRIEAILNEIRMFFSGINLPF